MKYLVFDEMSKDWDKAVENIHIHAEERGKGNLPERIFPDHTLHGDLPQLTQQLRGFKIYETDDPKQLTNIAALYTACDLKTWKRSVIPITDTSDFYPACDQYKKKVK